MAQREPKSKLRTLVDLRIFNNLKSDDYKNINQIIEPQFWNDFFVLNYNFTIGHFPGKINNAADVLSCLKWDLNGKIILKIREDVPTHPVEVNVE